MIRFGRKCAISNHDIQKKDGQVKLKKKKKKFTLASEDFETIKGENDIENTAFKYKSFAGPPII